MTRRRARPPQGTVPNASRRRVVGLAAGAGASLLLAGPAAQVVAADDGPEVLRAAGLVAIAARVNAVVGGSVVVEALDTADAPAEPWPPLPVSGFPWGLVPRVGDHVTVTDTIEGVDLAAVPLCAWIEATPTASTTGTYVVAERETVPIAAIPPRPAASLARAAGQERVAVCLLDGDLAQAIVLQVRFLAVGSGNQP